MMQSRACRARDPLPEPPFPVGGVFAFGNQDHKPDSRFPRRFQIPTLPVFFETSSGCTGNQDLLSLFLVVFAIVFVLGLASAGGGEEASATSACASGSLLVAFMVSK